MGTTKRYGLDWGDPEFALQELDAVLPGAWGPDLKNVVVATRTFAYFGGPVFNRVTGVTTLIADGTIVCPDNSTVVVQHDYSGTVTTASTLQAFNLPMAIVICASGVMTHFKDIREAAFDRRGLLPPGGNQGDLVVKASATDYDVAFQHPSIANPSSYPAGPLPDPDICRICVDADDVGGVADGAGMTTWPDQSPNGLDLSNAGGTAQPTYRAIDSEDGLPYVEFDGTTDYMRRTGMTEYTGGEITMYLVYRAGTSAGATDGICSFTKAGAQDQASTSRFVIVRASQYRAQLNRNNVTYEVNNSTGSGSGFYDGAFTWGVLAIRYKVKMGRAVLTMMHNNRMVSFDLGGTSLTALGLVAVFLGCRHNNGDGTTPDLFTNIHVRHFSYKHTTDTDLGMRDTFRYLAHKWGVPLMD